MFNIDTAKSYAIEANLTAALDRLGFSLDAQAQYMVVRNRAGRFTAVFYDVARHGGYVARFAAEGFITIG